jgi:tetratricopeptide (TPR) repeat protein
MKTTVMRTALLSVLIVPALSGGSHANAAEVDTKVAAREHFQKGLAAYADERFAEAADEFDAAYKLSPSFKLLYNIGLVDAALGRSVEAVDAFDHYLKQGASAIAPDRRQVVAAEIERQRGRIGSIAIRTFPEGADVRLDGVLVGQTPLSKQVPVNAGKHTVEAILAGHATQARSVSVAGRAEVALEIVLEAVVARAPDRPAPVPERTPAPPAAVVAPPAAPSITAPPSAPSSSIGAPSRRCGPRRPCFEP